MLPQHFKESYGIDNRVDLTFFVTIDDLYRNRPYLHTSRSKFQQNLAPIAAILHKSGDKEKLQKTMFDSTRITVFICSGVFTVFVPLVRPILALWLKVDDDPIIDCAYILKDIQAEANETVVEFKNIKKRGNVELSSTYSYSQEQGLSYDELFLSVEKVDDERLSTLKHNAEMATDAEVITSIEACIKDGINSKMKLADAAAERAKISRRGTIKVIDKYSGEDPGIHKWSFVYREHGAKVYRLLRSTSEQPLAPNITIP